MDETETQAVENQAPDTDEQEVKDTAQTQSSKASESETKSPEATQDNAEAEETSTPETNAEDTDEKLYAGKYKTVEDLEKAYKNAESKIGKETSQRAQLSQQLNESIAPEVSDTAQGNVPEAIYRDNAVIKFAMSHPDADGEAMTEVLTTDPYIGQINSYEARLEYAYAKAQGKSQAKAVEEAKKEAQKQTHAKIAEKEVAKVESAKKAEPVDEDAELVNKLKNGSAEERAQARKEIIRKKLINL